MEEFSFEVVLNNDFKICQEYLKKYFKPLPGGKHLVYVNNEYKQINQQTIKSVYFNRLPKPYYDWYFKVYPYEINLHQ